MKGNKLFAPTLITVLLCLWSLAQGVTILLFPGLPGFLRPAMIFPVLLAVASLYNLNSRIKEIRSGEEDDLDNY